MSNLALAKALADFADALADYNHLPALNLASVPLRGKVFARLQWREADDELVRQAAVWAEVFGQPVAFDLTAAGTASVSTLVEIGARPVHVSTLLSREGLREVELKYGLDRAPSGEVTEVPAKRLLAAIGTKAVA